MWSKFLILAFAFIMANFAYSQVPNQSQPSNFQGPVAEENPEGPQFTDQPLEKVPERNDDLKNENLLKTMAKKAGWFPNIVIRVRNGMVIIKGKVKSSKQANWLAQTASRLPHVIAVINKTEVVTPHWTDMTPFFKELKRINNLAKKNLPRVVVALVLFSIFVMIGLRIQRLGYKLWLKKIPNVFLANVVSKASMIPLWVILFYLTLMTVGLQSLATTIIGGTGILGIVLGFAFKGIAENYLSGLLLAIRSPFTQGDAVKIDGVEGLVQNLNMRGTTIMDWDGNLVLVPNTMVIQSVVKNFTANSLKRSNFVIGVGFNESIKQCQDLITQCLQQVPGIKNEPVPMIVVENIGSSTVNIRVYFWFDAKESSELTLKSIAIIKAKEILMANGIELPDTSRELMFADSLRIQMIQDPESAKHAQQSHKEELKSRAMGNLRESDQFDGREADHQRELHRAAESSALPLNNQKDNLLRQQ